VAVKPLPRYFASRKAYYCQLHGKQVRLGDAPNGDDSPAGAYYLAALESFKQLMERQSIGYAGDENKVKTLFDAHCEAVSKKKAKKTLKLRVYFLKHFCVRWSELPCSEVKLWHAEAVITDHPGWSASQTRLFLVNVCAAFAWGVKQEYLTRNPFKGQELPAVPTKARERLVSPEDHQAVLNGLRTKRSQRLRNVIVALENTGARPGEITNARVRNFNPAIGALVYFREEARQAGDFKHKMAHKKRDRIIYFTGEALAMVRSLCEGKKPDALLFPSTRGTAYNDESLQCCFYALRRRLKKKGHDIKGFVAYSYRHTYATNWLLNNGSIEVLAEVLGNTPETIRKHYSHIAQHHDSIRAQIERLRGGN
jgi:integrase